MLSTSSIATPQPLTLTTSTKTRHRITRHSLLLRDKAAGKDDHRDPAHHISNVDLDRLDAHLLQALLALRLLPQEGPALLRREPHRRRSQQVGQKCFLFLFCLAVSRRRQFSC